MKLLQSIAFSRVAPDRRAVARWLIHCADPIGPRTPPPKPVLSVAEVEELVRQADAHGVLPAVLRNYPAFRFDRDLAPAEAEGVALHKAALAYSKILRLHGEALLAEATDLPVFAVKGPVFAQLIYPSPQLRTFTDIDLLVAEEARAELSALLEARDFLMVEHDKDLREWKWVHRDNGGVMVEVHTDLVHASSLRGTMSLTHRHLAGHDRSPAGQLLVASVHASLGAHFDKLRNLVDVCQAARQLHGVEQERHFQQLVDTTGAGLAATTGLALAGKLFAEPRCLGIARSLGSSRNTMLARWLIDRWVVTSTTTSTRFLHAWRRQAFRQLLKSRERL